MKNNIALYQMGRKIGLKSTDIDHILKVDSNTDKPSFSAGPNSYSGGWYGTISIRDF